MRSIRAPFRAEPQIGRERRRNKALAVAPSWRPIGTAAAVVVTIANITTTTISLITEPAP